MKNYLPAVIGYLSLAIVYAYYLNENINSSKYITFGSFIIFYAYIVEAHKYYKKNLKQKDANDKTIFYNGALVFVFFYIISFYLPINEHHKISDLFALFGYMLVLNDEHSFIGYFLLVIYYLLYFKNHLLFTSYLEIFQVIGAIALIYHYAHHTNNTLHSVHFNDEVVVINETDVMPSSDLPLTDPPEELSYSGF
jgi:phosphatidylglycerophosphatase A